MIDSITKETEKRTEVNLLWTTKKALDEATKVPVSAHDLNDQQPGPSHQSLVQVTLPHAFNSASKQLADAAVVRLFYACRIPFVVAESQYFKDALASVINCSVGYKPPSRSAISNALLDKEVSNTEARLSQFKA